MDAVLFASLLSFSVSFLMIPIIIRLVVARSLLDLPGNRKIHLKPTPSMGGIALFSSILITLLLVVDFVTAPGMAGFLAALTIIFLVGLTDDILFINPFKKFSGQVLSVIVFLIVTGYRLETFGGFLGIGSLSPTMAFLFTALTMLVIINAFNLIDGVDGLAALMGVSTLTFLGIVFWMEGDSTHALVAFSSCTALIAFLLFNWNPARIFMGDTGSLVLGFINAVLVVRFIAFFTNQEATSIFSAAPAIGFALYFVPMADLLRLFIARLQLGKSPFEPDMQHLHHELLRNGLSHWQTSIVLVVSNGLFLAYSIFLQQLGNTVLILSMFGIASVLFLGYKRISIKSGSPNLKESSEQVPVETITRIINRDSFEEVKLLQ